MGTLGKTLTSGSSLDNPNPFDITGQLLKATGLTGQSKMDLSGLPKVPPPTPDLSDQFFKSVQQSKWNSMLGGNSYASSFLTPAATGTKSLLGS